MCVTWRIHMCDMTHSYVWHVAFICVTWRIYVCDMTHSYVWHDALICIHMCDISHCVCVTHEECKISHWVHRHHIHMTHWVHRHHISDMTHWVHTYHSTHGSHIHNVRCHTYHIPHESHVHITHVTWVTPIILMSYTCIHTCVHTCIYVYACTHIILM